MEELVGRAESPFRDRYPSPWCIPRASARDPVLGTVPTGGRVPPAPAGTRATPAPTRLDGSPGRVRLALPGAPTRPASPCPLRPATTGLGARCGAGRFISGRRDGMEPGPAAASATPPDGLLAPLSTRSLRIGREAPALVPDDRGTCGLTAEPGVASFSDAAMAALTSSSNALVHRQLCAIARCSSSSSSRSGAGCPKFMLSWCSAAARDSSKTRCRSGSVARAGKSDGPPSRRS
mmetsp:Transcript_11307/g.25060  ORF Transcript_11307/g.25060 Transcript_11307/m.25060 type:complete len:235 (-) Transcript_11307:232-936(-)